MPAFSDAFAALLDHGGPLVEQTDDALVFEDGTRVPVRDGIPRFTPDASYSTGNFSKLRERHATLQLDSVNGTNNRRDDFFRQTGWPADLLKGKTVLECGCGAGPDTEILASLGAEVLSVDIAGVDVAKKNMAGADNVSFLQASIMDLPLKEKSFDIVFCHRVIQHTPDPVACMHHIAKFVKPGGHYFVESYARNAVQMLNWKYLLLPLTNKMDPEKLYRMIEKAGSFLYRLSVLVNKLPWGRYINHVAVPFHNYSFFPEFAAKGDDYLIELGVHDTFDNLAPRYDKPVGVDDMIRVARAHLDRPWEIECWPTMTMIRTLVDETAPGGRIIKGTR